MAETTGIAWTDSTFNPWEGCTKVSPGCQFCYAEAQNKRWGKDNWGVGKERRRTTPANWQKPLKWNRNHGDVKAQYDNAGHGCRNLRVFCASLADWLDDAVPIEWLADLLALIAATPHLTWQLLTKRPENWLARVGAAHDTGMLDGNPLAFRMVENWIGGMAPVNVWLGTTVEDQRRADERIPALLAIPARVRFLSVEPQIEAVDLGRWLGDYDCHACNRRFYGDELNGFGASVKALDFRCDSDCTVTDGTCNCNVYVCPRCGADNGDGGCDGTVGEFESAYAQNVTTDIHWVIVGGESGHKARPFDLAWARSIVAQCAAAQVPVFVKQLGANARQWFCPIDSPETDGNMQQLRLRDSHGGNWDEWPADLRVRQFPQE